MRQNSIIRFFLMFLINLYLSNNSFCEVVEKNELIVEDEKVDLQKFELFDEKKSNQIKNLVEDTITKNDKKSLEISTSNDLSKFDTTSKIKDSSDYINANRNKLSEIIENEVNSGKAERIGLDEVPSPILKFILQKVRPFIEVRIDSMLIKAGFDSHLRQSIDLESNLKIKVVEESSSSGSGQKATCGQDAEISFSVEDEFGAVINDEYKDKKTWMKIGAGQFPKGMELGMIGMQIGETREITSPSDLNAGPTELSVRLFISKKPAVFRVKLHDFKEDELRDEIRENLRFFDVLGSISRQLSCVDFIQLNFRILDASGKILYKSSIDKPLKFVIGYGFNPYLEEILISAKNFGKRIAFVETKYLQDLKKVPYLNGISEVLDNNKAVVLELSPSLATN